jgi:hypothetical protein
MHLATTVDTDGYSKFYRIWSKPTYSIDSTNSILITIKNSHCRTVALEPTGLVTSFTGKRFLLFSAHRTRALASMKVTTQRATGDTPELIIMVSQELADIQDSLQLARPCGIHSVLEMPFPGRLEQRVLPGLAEQTGCGIEMWPMA